jgi:hypothetical protein
MSATSFDAHREMAIFLVFRPATRPQPAAQMHKAFKKM